MIDDRDLLMEAIEELKAERKALEKKIRLANEVGSLFLVGATYNSLRAIFKGYEIINYAPLVLILGIMLHMVLARLSPKARLNFCIAQMLVSLMHLAYIGLQLLVK